jgi:hypothetical protein
VEDQFSTAGRGVDLLGQALETDAPLLQPSDRLYKVWERSPQGDRILIPCIDVDRRLDGDLITGPWVVDQCSTLLLLLEI